MPYLSEAEWSNILSNYRDFERNIAALVEALQGFLEIGYDAEASNFDAIAKACAKASAALSLV